MSIGMPSCFPSVVVACSHFQSRNWSLMSPAPTVLRSTKYLSWVRKNAMSSPFTPVMSGSPLPAVKVVVSFCLKSPPMTS